ncbi:MAG: ferredoxin, partial [Myxococcota bacterium]
MIHRYADYHKHSIYHAEAIVVGTGAGGAAAGTTMAEAGVDVLFVEEGSYHPTSSFNPHMSESIPRLYRDSGTTSILGSPNIPYMEGRCVGGTTVLNGGMTYRAPTEVLEGWERITGDAGLGPVGMESLFDSVEEAVSAKRQLPTSVGDDNRIMALGAKKLGWKSQVNRRNQESCVGTNNCVYGCPTGAKQSTLVSYMPRAIKAGARCLTEVRVERLLIEGGRCVGVVGRAVDPRTMKRTHKVIVRADSVIVACGAIHTPHLLLKHRLGRPSKQLGRNFLCHPNAKVLALYPFDINAWQGVSQWTQVREFHSEGVFFAENMIPPAPLGAAIPWHGKRSMELLERYNQMMVTGVLVEDSTTGRVHRGPFDMPIARYDITGYDHTRFITGVQRLARLHFEMGAEM